jgi:hypothetical protein
MAGVKDKDKMAKDKQIDNTIQHTLYMAHV